jgi:hypothetical protein
VPGNSVFGQPAQIVVGSLVVGRAIRIRCGRSGWLSAAPFVGLAALIV